MRNPLGVKLVSEITKYIEIDINDMKNIFGQFDHYIKKIEKELQVMVIDRDGQVKVSGEENRVEKACKLLEEFIEMSKRGNMIEEQNINYAVEMSKEGLDDGLLELDGDCICHTVSGKPIKAKTEVLSIILVVSILLALSGASSFVCFTSRTILTILNKFYKGLLINLFEH